MIGASQMANRRIANGHAGAITRPGWRQAGEKRRRFLRGDSAFSILFHFVGTSSVVLQYIMPPFWEVQDRVSLISFSSLEFNPTEQCNALLRGPPPAYVPPGKVFPLAVACKFFTCGKVIRPIDFKNIPEVMEDTLEISKHLFRVLQIAPELMRTLENSLERFRII